jgi:hypothetical protein
MGPMLGAAAPAAAKGIGALGKGLIGGLGNIVGGLFGNRSRKREAQRQRDFSESMWNRQNAYNTPAMQMKRLKEAGLNPALMYGQGTTGNAEKALPYQQAQIESVGANFAQATAAGAQASIANSQAKLNNANAAYQGIAGAVKAKEFGLAKEIAGYTMDNLTADTKLKGLQAVNTAVDSTLKQSNINLNNEQIEQVKATTKKIVEDTNLVKTVIEKDYGKYGKNTFENGEILLKGLGVNPESAFDVLGALSALAITRNPAALGKIAGKATSKIGQAIANVKAYWNIKFGKKTTGQKAAGNWKYKGPKK